MITKTNPTKIVIKGDSQGIEKELPLKSTKTIVPGMLCERTTDGHVQPHSTAGTPIVKMWAIENPFIGVNGAFGAGRAFDTPYTTAEETVILKVLMPGSEVNALLRAGTGGDVAVGDLLTSNGDGTLKKYTAATAGAGGTGGTGGAGGTAPSGAGSPGIAGSAGTAGTVGDVAIAVALQAVDNDPGSGSVAVRIIVEVL